ncbi:ArsR family transcriptional regulator [Prauserella aidingensis]|uniref:ArsR/SmtB family transcription factor n=1 Tax=Prauserella aidingensis TaxID=387890 RepID=UPI0020A3FA8F|nr:metalloregulator ArsR/SmtB family transcription factor [Prauserella aidingensis]MCP2252665.1 ArsR family transcriptional regulator [Prauserella aidingensis]
MPTASSDAAHADPPGPGEAGGDGHVDAGHDPAAHDHPDGAVPPAPPPSQTALTDAGELLRALAAPVRIAIVLQLRDGDRCVHDLVDALDVAQPLISQHLRVLKAAGVVHGQRRGREVAYRLVDDHLAHIVVDAVAHVQEEAKR